MTVSMAECQKTQGQRAQQVWAGASKWGGAAGHGTLCFAPPVPYSREQPDPGDRTAGQAEAGGG